MFGLLGSLRDVELGDLYLDAEVGETLQVAWSRRGSRYPDGSGAQGHRVRDALRDPLR